MPASPDPTAVAAVRASFLQEVEALAALDAARAHRAEVVRENFVLISAAGWKPFARAVGEDPNGEQLVHESTLRALTRDLRIAQRAGRARTD